MCFGKRKVTNTIFVFFDIFAGMCSLYELSNIVYLLKFISNHTQVHKTAFVTLGWQEYHWKKKHQKAESIDSIKSSLAGTEIWVMKCPFSYAKKKTKKSHTNYTDPIRRCYTPFPLKYPLYVHDIKFFNGQRTFVIPAENQICTEHNAHHIEGLKNGCTMASIFVGAVSWRAFA